MGDIAEAQDRLEEAKCYYEQGLTLSKALEGETGTVESRRDLSVSYIKLGDIAKAQGRLEEAKGYYEQVLALRMALAGETGTVQAYDDLGVAYIKLWQTADPGSGEEREYLSQVVRVYRMLAGACPQVKKYQNTLELLEKYLGE